ncbi:MAG: hypothetical protein PHW10_02170 [Candidatus Peribacteraceae bacterium]|nr:hypothetical protein [Candidatus Peribacteraceae bacterium]
MLVLGALFFFLDGAKAGMVGYFHSLAMMDFRMYEGLSDWSVLRPDDVLLRLAEWVGGEGRLLARAQSLRFLAVVAPFVLLHAAGAVLLYLFGGVFILSLLRRDDPSRQAVAAIPRLLGPALRLCVRLVAASWIWVPLVFVFLGKLFFAAWGEELLLLSMAGVLLFLFRAPRYAVAPLLLIDGRGVRESLSGSREKTRGFRWSFTVELVSAALALAVLTFLGGVLLRHFLAPLPAAFLASTVRAAAFCVWIVWYGVLGQAVLEASVSAEVARDPDDAAEGSGLEGSAADQGAVDIPQRQ